VTKYRAYLLNALRGISNGDSFTNEELLGTIPDPSDLDEIERAAWYRLSHWADDDDIRSTDASYAEMQQRQIVEALADLEALEAGSLPDEVSRGEHQAWHIPVLGCLLVTGIVVAGAYLFVSHML
jgi:hypothetical protein